MVRSYLGVPTDRVDDIEALPSHGGIQPTLEISQFPVSLCAIADAALLDALGH